MAKVRGFDFKSNTVNLEFHVNIIVAKRIGGLGVACWPLVPKFAGSNPAEAVGF